MKARLILEDGSIFTGNSFASEKDAFGEIVFNTSMSGYQEIITDPSYAGQIVMMTYPHIGNYGVNSDDMESEKPFLKGFIVKELCDIPSNYRSEESLEEFLKRNGITGLQGIDTRAVTRRIRETGAMRCMITTSDLSDEELVAKVMKSEEMAGSELASFVSSEKPQTFGNDGAKYHVAVLDFGVKGNILQELLNRECRLTVLPAKTSADDILKINPDGVLLSNGPGDPAAVDYAIENIRKLVGQIPVFGICLGHQLLALALGAETYKLKFGHRGANHPVKELSTGKVEITVQNHGFAVTPDSINDDEIEITHLNLNDGTIEGLRHKKLPLFSVQYHPEASPGPHDSRYLFDRFIDMMKENGS